MRADADEKVAAKAQAPNHHNSCDRNPAGIDVPSTIARGGKKVEQQSQWREPCGPHNVHDAVVLKHARDEPRHRHFGDDEPEREPEDG